MVWQSSGETSVSVSRDGWARGSAISVPGATPTRVRLRPPDVPVVAVLGALAVDVSCAKGMTTL
jgi:hypothetical protein